MCLSRAAPEYLTRMCEPWSPLRNNAHLKSAAQSDLFVPQSTTAAFGERTFVVCRPTTWNALSLSVRAYVMILEHINGN